MRYSARCQLQTLSVVCFETAKQIDLASAKAVCDFIAGSARIEIV
jgi:hypothetical protein